MRRGSVCTGARGKGGGTRGETGARKEGGKGACQLCRRRVTNRPTACPGFSRYPLSLSLSFSLSLTLSLSALQSIGSVFASQCSSRVPLRAVPPASSPTINRSICLSSSSSSSNLSSRSKVWCPSANRPDRSFLSTVKSRAKRFETRETLSPYSFRVSRVPAREAKKD